MKQRILFIDDEPNVLEAFRRALHSRWYLWELHFAENAAQAWSLMREFPIDVIVSDILMPGMNGFELLEEIRATEETQDIPVIMLTGKSETSLKRRALDLGATDLLNKPVTPEDLLARLHSALRLKAYQDQLKNQNALLEQKVAERTQELEHSRLEILWRLGKAAEFRDAGTGHHILRVSCFSYAIGQRLGLDNTVLEMLLLASPLHDIGKIGIPDSILFKPGKLSPEEWAIMQGHCCIGARILQEEFQFTGIFQSRCADYRLLSRQRKEDPLLDMAVSIALAHHEKWDGSGYPAGLAREQIPLEARIVALADVYDALSTKRPYKPAYPEKQVLEIMAEGAGNHFDPEAYTAFVRALDTLRDIQAQFPDDASVSPGRVAYQEAYSKAA